MLGDEPEVNWNDIGDSCTEDLGESKEYEAGERLGVPTSRYLHKYFSQFPDTLIVKSYDKFIVR